MKAFFNSTLVAFSMFCSIPMPHKRIRWDERGMRYMMAAFPLIGIVIGAVVYAWLALSGWLSLPDTLRRLGILLIPVALTGGIHLDGFADTCDALKANTTPEKRREILKDPRAGAFAVIGIAVYFAAYLGFAFSFDLETPSVLLLCIGYVLTRSLSGFAVITVPSASEGTAKMFRDAAARRSVIILAAIIALCIAAAVAVCLYTGHDTLTFALWLFAALCTLLHVLKTAKRKFGGMSGDLAGWFLQLCELFQLAAIVLGPYLYAAIVRYM